MKTRLAALLLSTLAATALWARPVSDDEARLAVSRWLIKFPCPVEAAKLEGVAETVHSISNETGTALFHVVPLSRGGFVVTSAETTIAPVVAFSDSGDLPVSPGNPLYDILAADMGRRLEQTAQTGVATRRSLSVISPAGLPQADESPPTPTTEEEAAWTALLAEQGMSPRRALSAGADEGEPFDVRVPRLVATAWGQYDAAATYTPNNYPCGCVALVGAQIAKYWRHPTTSRPQVTRPCGVVSAGGAATYADFTTRGGLYDWGSMPNVISSQDATSSITDTQKSAVGKLCYDFGVAVRTEWGADGSAAFGFLLNDAFPDVFGFANSRAWIGEAGSAASQETVERTVLANLDAKCPVALGIERHMVVADGYGFSGTTLYTHINIGWDGRYDAWYNLPTVKYASTSTVLDEIVYNVFPEKTGDLLTGRVVDTYGTPITNASVMATDGGGQGTAATTLRTTTDARGIYAFWVKGGKTWTLTAAYAADDGTVATGGATATVGECVSTQYDSEAIRVTYGTGALGNSWGNDIALAISVTTAPETPTDVRASQGEIYGEVRVDWTASAGAISYDILRAAEGAPNAARIGSTAETHFYDTAAEAGTTNFYWVVAVNAVGQSAPSAPARGWSADTPPVVNGNDNFADAYVLTGSSGSTTGSTVGMTREPGEPAHTTTAGSSWDWWERVGSAWWKWTAPTSATVVFDTAGSDFDTIMAIYTGSTVTTLNEIDSNDDTTSTIRTSHCEFDAVAGTTYFIVVTGYYYDTGPEEGRVRLAWQSPSPPDNDAFAHATALSGPSGSAAGTGVLSTREVGEPAHAGNTTSGSVWWRWTAPAAGTAVFDTEGSSFDTLLAVYTGSSLAALSEVASDDDGGAGTASRCAFAVSAGTVYSIAVSGFGRAGTIALNWSFVEKTYTATFNANGGNGGTTRKLVRGAALSAPKVSRMGYVFAGWSPAVPTTMPAANVTYMAKWTPITYKVAFNANGGKSKMAAQAFTYDKAAKLRKNAFIRSGYVFIGWAMKKGGAVKYKNAAAVKNLSTKNGSTATLYAVWAKKTYKVAFFGTYKNVTGKMAVESFSYGKAKRLSKNTFKRKGYVFKGWAKSKALAKKGTVIYKNKQKVKNLVITGKTVKLYAVWKKSGK